MGLFLLLAAISVGGVVVGPTGLPVAGAKVTLRDASQAVLRSTVSGLDGRFALEGAPSGAFLLRVGDRNYRGMGWGVDGAGRGVSLRWKYRF